MVNFESLDESLGFYYKQEEENAEIEEAQYNYHFYGDGYEYDSVEDEIFITRFNDKFQTKLFDFIGGVE